ncbi:MAG TPA: ABC transporter permease [Candidatus Coprenecus pullistercoris]|nr:ABC transporter permease [Candidatus Coprenecus pullistercoris]
MRLVWKLIIKHIRFSQLAGFILANVAGVSIFLLGVQFYRDVSPLLSGSTSLIGDDYVIISKKVNTIKSLNARRGNVFSPEEIEEIRRLEFVDEVGAFRSASFQLYGEVCLGETSLELGTDMFFESVPDGFVDCDMDRWRYEEGQRTVPIILPRSYLDLYNLAFAPAQGLPQITEGMAARMTLILHISGKKDDVLTGRLTGFTDRLNTILVPDSFLKYANSVYGYSPDVPPLRLILKVNSISDSELTSFMSSKNYYVAEGSDSASRVAVFLKTAVSIVSLVGLIICAVSLFVLVLSTYLIVEKNLAMHENLLRIGCSPLDMTKPYMAVTGTANLIACALSLVLVITARSIYLDRLAAFLKGHPADGLTELYAVAAAVLICSTAIAVIAVYRKISSI